MNQPRESAIECCRTICFNDQKIQKLKRALPAVDQLAKVAAWHKVMGHPVRLAIIRVLELDDCCVCDLANVLAQPVSTVSQHLKALRQCGLVEARQEGKLVICSLSRSSSWGELVPRSMVEMYT